MKSVQIEDTDNRRQKENNWRQMTVDTWQKIEEANGRPIIEESWQITEDRWEKTDGRFADRLNDRQTPTTSANIQFLNRQYSAMGMGDCACLGLFLDFGQAFDLVNLAILSEKLLCCVRGVVLKWFESYLQGRHTYVEVEMDGVTSSSLPTKKGVPQGSIVSPIL